MNVLLLRKVSTWLKRLRHTKHFDMTEWAEKTSCGTSYCVAGKVLELSGYKPRFKFDKDPYIGEVASLEFLSPKGKNIRSPQVTAARLLGITRAQAARLFFLDMWPSQFFSNTDDLGYFLTAGEKTTPKLAAKRIEHFIKTHGRE